MPPRQRGELFVRGRADEDRWRDEKKGRLTLQAAQVWEERDGRTDAAIAPVHLRSASLKFKCHPSAHLVASEFLLRNLDFGRPSSAKSATSHARSTCLPLIRATRLRLRAGVDPPGRCIEERNETAPAGKRRHSLRACPPARR